MEVGRELTAENLREFVEKAIRIAWVEPLAINLGQTAIRNGVVCTGRASSNGRPEAFAAKRLARDATP